MLEELERGGGGLTPDIKLDHKSSARFFSFSFLLSSSSAAICSASSFFLKASSSFLFSPSFCAAPSEVKLLSFSSSFIPPLRFLLNDYASNINCISLLFIRLLNVLTATIKQKKILQIIKLQIKTFKTDCWLMGEQK